MLRRDRRSRCTFRRRKSSMPDFLQKNPRILILIIALILVSGCVGFVFSPRMEDPRLTPRFAQLVTILPGADAERVESLVTEKLELAIREIEEVKQLRSITSTNVSFIVIELNDNVDEVGAENAWALVRDKAEDARMEMPADATAPEFSDFNIMANAAILALKWDGGGEPNYAILTRLMKQLRDGIDFLSGTAKTELFGTPDEEILVTLDGQAMTAMNLRPFDISRAIAASDSKVSAGLLRSNTDNILLEVDGELDTLGRIGGIPVQLGDSGSFIELASVCNIEKTIKKPMDTKVILQDCPAVAVGVQIQPETRIDAWSNDLDKFITQYERQLPTGISLVRVFEQGHYVRARTASLFSNLLYGAGAIFVVIFLMMGWRAAWIVGLALPLVSLTVLGTMYFMEIPIHQMSITGLIIALGLMIDNAIVVVDEIAQRLREGHSRIEAVRRSTSFLLMPLIGSTVTTALSFSPIILMEGGAGEFVGSIAVVAVVAVISSFVLAMTVIASIAGLGLPDFHRGSWSNSGVSFAALSAIYSRLISSVLRNPLIGIVAGVTLPVLGFLVAADLKEEFFPPSERPQFRVDIELPATASIEQTERYSRAIGERLLARDEITDVKWFLGESALMFYYNVIPLRQNMPQFAQAIVECKEGTDTRALIRELQAKLEPEFPKAFVLLRQLEQGPAFDAPVEVRLQGPDENTLREVGDELRLLCSKTPHIHHTRATFSESLPVVSFVVDEQQARLAGLNHLSIAADLNTKLEGVTGGSIVEASEELPVRVRVSGDQRQDINSVASLDLLTAAPPMASAMRGMSTEANQPANQPASLGYRGVPLSAISRMEYQPKTVSISRLDGERMNEIQCFIDAGVLPSVVLNDFRKRLAASDIKIPPGYKLTYGGAEERRNDAVGSLIDNIFIVVALMVAAMVISLGSFRFAGLLFMIAGLSIGLGLGSLWLVGHPWGFMSIVGMMGMIGVAVNDSIVVLAAIRALPAKKAYDIEAVSERVLSCTRHILSTTLTTIVGFTPLFLYGGDFWSPVAIAISGGVGGATIIALIMVPSAYMLIGSRREESAASQPSSNGRGHSAQPSFPVPDVPVSARNSPRFKSST